MDMMEVVGLPVARKLDMLICQRAELYAAISGKPTQKSGDPVNLYQHRNRLAPQRA